MLSCYGRFRKSTHQSRVLLQIFTQSKITSVVRHELFHGHLRKKNNCQLNCDTHLNDIPVWRVDWSHHPLNAVQHFTSTPRIVAISCGVKGIVWHMIGYHFAHFSVTTHNTATASCGFTLFLCT